MERGATDVAPPMGEPLGLAQKGIHKYVHVGCGILVVTLKIRVTAQLGQGSM